MHAEGGDHDDGDGDGGGSDSEDSGDEDGEAGPAGQAAAEGAGGGGGNGGAELQAELQAQLAAINVSLQHILQAATLLQELLAEWGQQQLVDHIAAAVAQLSNASQQLNADLLQAAADELDEVGGTAFPAPDQLLDANVVDIDCSNVAILQQRSAV